MVRSSAGLAPALDLPSGFLGSRAALPCRELAGPAGMLLDVDLPSGFLGSRAALPCRELAVPAGMLLDVDGRRLNLPRSWDGLLDPRPSGGARTPGRALSWCPLSRFSALSRAINSVWTRVGDLTARCWSESTPLRLVLAVFCCPECLATLLELTLPGGRPLFFDPRVLQNSTCDVPTALHL